MELQVRPYGEYVYEKHVEGFSEKISFRISPVAGLDGLVRAEIQGKEVASAGVRLENGAIVIGPNAAPIKVVEEYRGEGLGTAIVDVAISYGELKAGKQLKMEAVALPQDTNTGAHIFFESIGFTRDQEKEEYRKGYFCYTKKI